MDVVIRLANNHTDSNKLGFYYSDERIEFERVALQSPAKKVRIKVRPDCSIVVAAPESAPDNEVLEAVKKRGRWIYQQVRQFRKQLQHITPRQYISGESHYYLGKQYVLKVREEPHAPARVKLLRGQLKVNVRQKSPASVKAALDDWYKARAKEVFHKRLDAVLEQAIWVTERPPLRILTMKTQWGSCSPAGRITLNPLLVKAPRDCIDYVILHELCHIAEHNHSERFYRLMGQVIPDWQEIKNQLDFLSIKF